MEIWKFSLISVTSGKVKTNHAKYRYEELATGTLINATSKQLARGKAIKEGR